MKTYAIIYYLCDDVTLLNKWSLYEVDFVLVEKTFSASFQRYIILIPKLCFSKFRNLCHVTDDVIMGHVTKIGGIFFSKMFPNKF